MKTSGGVGGAGDCIGCGRGTGEESVFKFKPTSSGLGSGTKIGARARSGLTASLLAAGPDYNDNKESFKKMKDVNMKKTYHHFYSDWHLYGLLPRAARTTPLTHTTTYPAY